MQLEKPAVLDRLRKFDFTGLFTQELGWNHPGPNLAVMVGGTNYQLQAVAEKRGVQVFLCPPLSDGSIPEYSLRQKIEKQVKRSAYEHLILFTDKGESTQIWQWVARAPSQPALYREHHYRPQHHDGESLLQKLAHIAIPLSEDEALDLTGTVHRLRDAFDRDRVTKRFFERFKAEHGAFLEFIKGITSQADQEWYASLMLNRLMFVYFIQKKGFLDGNTDYLRDRLRKVQARKGKDKFLSFYRYFLLVLFHQGFGRQPQDRELDAELKALLGDVRYINGGLFDEHSLEQRYLEIKIEDKAFENLFAFFEQYDWHLDTRPLHSDRDINPDVLGYIFEKYINQKQMGAYYTKEDITDYISKNTIIPYLFDAAKKKQPAAFKAGSSLWNLLQADPLAYIYPAVRHGVYDAAGQFIPLPKEIAKGQTNVKERDGWNRPAAAPFALPTETWREHVARRERCIGLKGKLEKGEVHEINDLITLNLNVRQFAQDVLVECDDPELLRAFWRAIRDVTVLDPTCGSGAFLFAALNILQPLYQACLGCMQGFVEEADKAGAKKKLEDFRKTLDEIDLHASEDYFILKSIVVRNLYGVDLMEEATEICKLRLFLKLVAQIDSVNHLEPLPDIDFNIRAGNTLVGFATLAEVKKTVVGTLADKELLGDVNRIVEDAETVDRAFLKFHEMQTTHGVDSRAFRDAKSELRRRLDKLTDGLDQYLAADYKIDASKLKALAAWTESHQPFHWFAEFFGILSKGGFHVIVGNPPYVEYSKVRRSYQALAFRTEVCGNLYAMCIERSYAVLADAGRFGFIVQAPLVSTQRMAAARKMLREGSQYLAYSTYDDRPSKLFDGMHHCRLAIVLAERNRTPSPPTLETTRYHKWYKDERPTLFQTVAYQTLPADSSRDIVPKFRCAAELSAYAKVLRVRRRIGDLLTTTTTKHQIFYKITGVGHWFTFTLSPPKFWRNGKVESSSRESCVSFPSKPIRDSVYCCLCSSLHYWLYQVRTNCRDFNPSDLEFMPVPEELGNGTSAFTDLALQITERLEKTSEVGEGTYAVGGSVKFQKFRPKSTKDLLDAIDRILGKSFDLTADELDFVINYDVKYRMGGQESDEDEE